LPLSDEYKLGNDEIYRRLVGELLPPGDTLAELQRELARQCLRRLVQSMVGQRGYIVEEGSMSAVLEIPFGQRPLCQQRVIAKATVVLGGKPRSGKRSE
jgi:hypothetical protein